MKTQTPFCWNQHNAIYLVQRGGDHIFKINVHSTVIDNPAFIFWTSKPGETRSPKFFPLKKLPGSQGTVSARELQPPLIKFSNRMPFIKSITLVLFIQKASYLTIFLLSFNVIKQHRPGYFWLELWKRILAVCKVAQCPQNSSSRVICSVSNSVK